MIASQLAPHAPALGIDATSVFWFDYERGLARAPKSGGAPTPLWPEARYARAREHSSIAIDEANVYFTFNTTDFTEPGRQRLLRQSKNGDPPAVLADLRGGTLAGVVIDKAHLYWVQDGFIMRAAKAGGGAARIAPGQIAEPPLAVDDAHIYWHSYLDDGSIRAAPKTGGFAKVVVKNVKHAHALLVDDVNLYWATGNNVMVAPKTGGATVQLAQASHEIDGFALDRTHLYFTVPAATTPMSAEGTVWRVAIDGSTTTLLAAGQRRPGGIAVDDDAVYWTSFGTLERPYNGTVSKLEKTR